MPKVTTNSESVCEDRLFEDSFLHVVRKQWKWYIYIQSLQVNVVRCVKSDSKQQVRFFT